MEVKTINQSVSVQNKILLSEFNQLRYETVEQIGRIIIKRAPINREFSLFDLGIRNSKLLFLSYTKLIITLDP